MSEDFYVEDESPDEVAAAWRRGTWCWVCCGVGRWWLPRWAWNLHHRRVFRREFGEPL